MHKFSNYIWDYPMRLINEIKISESLEYHLKNKIPLSKSIFRYGSESFISLIKEVGVLVRNKDIEINDNDTFIISEFNEEKVIVEGFGEVILDFIYQEESFINEAEYKGKKVDLNKPKRGGSKKFFVYVKDPKTKNIKKVSFGAKSGGGKLSVKLNDPKARNSFAKRHNCTEKDDKTKPGYWSCRLPRYTHLLNLKPSSGVWW